MVINILKIVILCLVIYKFKKSNLEDSVKLEIRKSKAASTASFPKALQGSRVLQMFFSVGSLSQ